MAISFILQTSVSGLGATGTLTTFPAEDTSGADFFALYVAWYSGYTPPITVSDNKMNSWTAIPASPVANGFVEGQWFYSIPTSVGSGHTFSVAGTGFYPSLYVLAFAGVDQTSPFDQESDHGESSSATIQAGSLTAAQNGSVYVIGQSNIASIAPADSIDSGFTYDSSQNYAPGNSIGGGCGHLIQGAAAAENPTWDFTTNGPTNLVAVMAVFKPAASGATSWGPLLSDQLNRLVQGN